MGHGDGLFYRRFRRIDIARLRGTPGKIVARQGAIAVVPRIVARGVEHRAGLPIHPEVHEEGGALDDCDPLLPHALSEVAEDRISADLPASASSAYNTRSVGSSEAMTPFTAPLMSSPFFRRAASSQSRIWKLSGARAWA